ncbi:MAG: EAL domain-containing protein [Clostridiales bacterium]|nr:EAL domain-containing protein [Clostridiales bacterium]
MINKIIKDAPINNFFMKYGVYTTTDRGLPISDMCDRAQMAIESIKHQFGYCYAIYDDKFRQKLMREHQLNDYKEQALKESQFLVYLQPKHDSKTREIVGAEALVRWKHPELGFILPNEFIPLFERNGFITKLDEYVWNIACQILHRWQNENKKFIPISVNASRNDFMQENLPEMLFNLVKKYDIPAEMLHIEITESAYTDNPQQIISVVSSLRYMGFLIEMDDFGSGYSSLNMLSELPIDILKLDMRFMQQADSVITNRKRSILSFIISLSKLLELSTVAEGVETEEEVGLLSEMGCDYIQGYYFAKPMPIDEFEKYLIDYEKSTISTK